MKIKHHKIKIKTPVRFKVRKIKSESVLKDNRVRLLFGLVAIAVIPWNIQNGDIQRFTQANVTENYDGTHSQTPPISSREPVFEELGQKMINIASKDFAAHERAEMKEKAEKQKKEEQASVEEKEPAKKENYTVEENKQIIRASAKKYGVDQNMALCISFAESGWNEKATNYSNSNGSNDIGLWQINSVHKISNEKRFDPYWSTDWSMKKLAQGRQRMWYGYRSNNYNKCISNKLYK